MRQDGRGLVGGLAGGQVTLSHRGTVDRTAGTAVCDPAAAPLLPQRGDSDGGGVLADAARATHAESHGVN